MSGSTRQQLVNKLAAIERLLSERVELWRQIVNPDGTLGARIYSGSFQRPRGPEPPEERKPR
jgi:hypothetical protein